MTVSEQLKFLNEYKTAQNAASGSKVDSNANVTEKNIATLATEGDKFGHIELQRAVMQKYLTKYYDEKLAAQYLKDLHHHIIYRHDETTGAGGYPYCVAMTMYPFITDGLKDLGGNSEAPQHMDSFMGGFCNLLFIVAAQFAGAVATPEWLTYCDHFLRIDYGQDYINHLDDVVERSTKPKTLRDRIYGWFAQVIYTINQPAAARGNQSIFWNIAYFDKYYFDSIFEGFVFPDGDEPKWESVKELQKLFMRWFNHERLRNILTFPVETANCLVKDGKYADSEMADFFAQMWSEGASFFMYQSDSVDALSSCCRLRNAVEKEPFSNTFGAGGVETGSKAVITMNLNRIVQDWDRDEDITCSLSEYVAIITRRIHKYLTAFNRKLWDDYNSGLLTIYKAGLIELDKQYLTIGINGFVEAAEYLGIKIDPDDEDYRQFAHDILTTIEETNKADRTEYEHYNLEFVPAENLGVKNYNWDKRDGYKVNPHRNCYNSYFYPVEENIDPVKRFFYQGYGFADQCSGGVALHNNLAEHLTKGQYRKLMDVAVQAGCNYFTYNIRNTVCPHCGYIDKHTLDQCPKCGSTELDYATRIIGYLKLERNFSAARQEEAAKRAYTLPGAHDGGDLQ